MKISYPYLKNFLNTRLTKKKLTEVFTKVGFECEIDGNIIEFDVTPNRGDVLSLRGLQREFCASQSQNFQDSLKLIKLKAKSNRSIINQIDKQGCLNYHLLLIRDISSLKKLDMHKRKFLTDAGIPLINPLVDLGNYVMLEIGAPMHVFDLDQLSLPINVKFPKSNNQPFQVIGGDIKNIQNSSLTIQDNQGVQAIAGIIGGDHTAVTKNTKNIAVEAAFFNPEKIVNQARKYGLATDASHRFERGVDPQIQKLALERYLYLLNEIANYKNAECFISDHGLPNKKPVTINTQRFNSFAGLDLKPKEIKKILKHLELHLVSETSQNLKFTIPSHRFDILQEEDLYEELLRCYGYDNIPVNVPRAGPKKDITSDNFTSNLRLGLVHAGFTELIHLPFVSRDTYFNLVDNSSHPAELINPINDGEPLMRGSLFGALFSAVNSNLKKGYLSIKVFESGNVFKKIKNSFIQDNHLAGLVYNHELQKTWGSKEFSYDFYSIKAEVIKLLKTVDIKDIKFQHAQNTKVFTSNALEIFQGNIKIGVLGEINLSATQKLLKKPCYGFELYPEKIFEDYSNFKITKFSKFPSSSRDINIIIPKSFNYGKIEEKLSKSIKKIKYFATFQLVNIFEGKGIPSGYLSMTLRFTFQSNIKSLLDSEVSSGMEQISKILKDSFKAETRS
ncbi:MAG: phenylalanine--tRNA ligase subunit beta [SAR86 cluster bacterium]|nr:phenylalanine--tRNA ligase subunit beta [SAR86 cluster bacterium]